MNARRDAWLLDFDGTVAPVDIGARVIARFATGSPEGSRALLERWMRGEVGHRELTEAECRRIDATREEVLEFTRDFGLDPEFADFARAAFARGDQVMIVSEGLDVYIADLLERAGLSEIPWAANHARFEDRRLVPTFPHARAECGSCGNCKGGHVRDFQSMGHRVIFVGDGFSDRCGARAADVVFARDALLEWCRTAGVPAHPFPGFAALAGSLAA